MTGRTRTKSAILTLGVMAIALLFVNPTMGVKGAARPPGFGRLHMPTGCPYVMPTEGFYDCYHARQLHSVTRAFRSATGADLLSPIRAVEAPNGLRLTWVAVYWYQMHTETPRLVTIDYVFGRVRGGAFGTPALVRPRFVDVTESPVRTGQTYPAAIQISRESYDSSGLPWPWQARFGIATRHLDFSVTSNESKRTVRLVAERIQASR
jgi:hypothetical protein